MHIEDKLDLIQSQLQKVIDIIQKDIPKQNKDLKDKAHKALEAEGQHLINRLENAEQSFKERTPEFDYTHR